MAWLRITKKRTRRSQNAARPCSQKNVNHTCLKEGPGRVQGSQHRLVCAPVFCVPTQPRATTGGGESGRTSLFQKRRRNPSKGSREGSGMGGRHAATTHASPAFPILGKMNSGARRVPILLVYLCRCHKKHADCGATSICDGIFSFFCILICDRIFSFFCSLICDGIFSSYFFCRLMRAWYFLILAVLLLNVRPMGFILVNFASFHLQF